MAGVTFVFDSQTTVLLATIAQGGTDGGVSRVWTARRIALGPWRIYEEYGEIGYLKLQDFFGPTADTAWQSGSVLV